MFLILPFEASDQTLEVDPHPVQETLSVAPTVVPTTPLSESYMPTTNSSIAAASSAPLSDPDTVPASTRPSAAQLGGRVFEVLREVQALERAGRWPEAMAELNALYADFDELVPSEQTALLNFYVSVMMKQELYDESIVAFEQMLQVEGIDAAAETSVKLKLGHLHAQQGDPAASVRYLNEWLTESGAEERRASPVWAQLAMSYNALGQYADGIAALERHMAMEVNRNRLVSPEAIELLRAMNAAAGNSTAVQPTL